MKRKSPSSGSKCNDRSWTQVNSNYIYIYIYINNLIQKTENGHLKQKM